MTRLKARVAYLQGLAAGLEMPADSKEARLLEGIVEILGEFAETVDDLEVSQERLEDYLESIDEDLYGLERDIYPDEDEHGIDTQYLDVVCPECEEAVGLDDRLAEDGGISMVNCPHCEGEISVKHNPGRMDAPDNRNETH